MTNKKDDSNINWKQLDLPFGKIDSSRDKKTQPKNIISFSSKVKEINDKEENNIRKKSINRLVDYAEKLNW